MFRANAANYRLCLLPWLFSSILLLLPATSSLASEIGDEIQGTIQDEAEASGVFKKDWRFVPVPIPISDPTIGTGLAVAGIYMHPKKEGSSDTQTTLSGLVGLYTSTDSWMGAAFHSGSYGGDTVRISGGLAYGEFNLKFYGIGNDSPIRDNPISYEAQTSAFLPRILFRLPFDNWFVGPRYVLLKIDNTFDLSSILPSLPEIRIQGDRL